jgi:SAM-dependent methyltransferase
VTTSGQDRAALYDRLPLVAGDRWWLELAAAADGGRVVELGAGAGRLTAALVATGAEVVAVEADPAMLERLRRRAPDAEVVAHDLTAGPPPGAPAALVVLPSSLVNEQRDVAARRALLRAAAACVAPGGRLALHLLNPWWLTGLEGRTVGRLVPASADEAPVEVTVDAGPFDAFAGRRQATLTYRFADGWTAHDHLDAAVVPLEECRADLVAAGLEVLAVHGGDPPAAPDPAEPAWHVLAARPGSDHRDQRSADRSADAVLGPCRDGVDQLLPGREQRHEGACRQAPVEQTAEHVDPVLLDRDRHVTPVQAHQQFPLLEVDGDLGRGGVVAVSSGPHVASVLIVLSAAGGPA